MNELRKVEEYRPRTPALDKSFREYIEGKTVAIVGRSGIHHLKQGEFIDSHDVVVRVHDPIPYTPNQSLEDNWAENQKWFLEGGDQYVPNKWHETVGQRADVIYFKFRLPTPVFLDDRNNYVQRWLKAVKNSGAKFFCRDVMTNQHQYENAHIANFVPVRYPSRELLDWIASQIEELVEAGTIDIMDILVQKPASVYVTGFPTGYGDKIVPGLPGVFKTNHRPRNFRFLCHVYQSGYFTCDEVMEKLFKTL